MNKHQIIFTSCMRGINGVNDGQQIFSYDADFKDSKSEDVRSLFTYQTPALEVGVVMSEEIALIMPKSFIFRKLNNGTCAVTLNTYLGRDYMGSAGRFGNSLSHSIICDEAEYTSYPCEFYGSEMLRDSMAYEEVNNPKIPSFLPTPELLRGYRVDIDNVIEFLGEDDRMDIFKNMLHAMLSFESERKRIVMCDKADNIIMWIAALEYTLPLKIALNINFTTYEYDPSLSRSQICGVVPNGTKYNFEAYESLQSHFVFDLYRNDTVDFNIKGDFYDFIEVAMSFSHDILKSFHEFLINSYSYSKADLDYYNAYSLYKLRKDGILEINRESFANAVSFADKFADDGEKIALIEQLLFEKDKILTFDNNYSLEVFRYIIGSYGFLSALMQEQTKSAVIERILNSFLGTEISKEEFTSFYTGLEELCNAAGISIAAELMNEDNQQKIFGVIKHDVSNWKLAFIIKVLCDYVKVKTTPAEELYVEHPIGNLYAGIVQSVYSINENNGFYVVTRILEEFSNDHEYLTNIALNLDGVMSDLTSGEAAARSLWQCFYQVAAKSQYENRNAVFTILNGYNRREQMYGLFKSLLNRNPGSTDGDILFREHFESFVAFNQNYSQEYLPQILGAYYDNVKSTRNRDITPIENELLGIIHQNKLDVPFVDELIGNITKKIPLERPSKENTQIVMTIFEYNFDYPRQAISGKVFLICVGMNIEKIKSNKDLQPVMAKLERLVDDKKVNLLGLTEKDADNYLEWIVPYITNSCQTSNDLIKLYNLFDMSPRVSEMYIVMCAKDYLKQSKSDKDYNSFCEFLKFLFTVENTNGLKATGKVLHTLSKKKLELMDSDVKIFFGKDRNALHYWDEIKEISSSTNPLLKNIRNFVRRKRG
ncbi:MAG: hypothetical protein K0A89_06060 [ANME-2 cluster archaeon]|nr:hypothetical protein [ANME-2 cluster archaeon]